MTQANDDNEHDQPRHGAEDADSELRYLLTAYLFDGLSEEGKREVEAELERSAACRAELNELQDTLGLVEDALADDNAGADSSTVPRYSFEKRRLERVLQASQRRTPFKRRFAVRGWIAAAAGILLSVTLLPVLLEQISPLSVPGDEAMAPVAGTAVFDKKARELASAKRGSGWSEAVPAMRRAGGVFEQNLSADAEMETTGDDDDIAAAEPLDLLARSSRFNYEAPAGDNPPPIKNFAQIEEPGRTSRSRGTPDDIAMARAAGSRLAAGEVIAEKYAKERIEPLDEHADDSNRLEIRRKVDAAAAGESRLRKSNRDAKKQSKKAAQKPAQNLEAQLDKLADKSSTAFGEGKVSGGRQVAGVPRKDDGPSLQENEQQAQGRAFTPQLGRQRQQAGAGPAAPRTADRRENQVRNGASLSKRERDASTFGNTGDWFSSNLDPREKEAEGEGIEEIRKEIEEVAEAGDRTPQRDNNGPLPGGGGSRGRVVGRAAVTGKARPRGVKRPQDGGRDKAVAELLGHDGLTPTAAAGPVGGKQSAAESAAEKSNSAVQQHQRASELRRPKNKVKIVDSSSFKSEEMKRLQPGSTPLKNQLSKVPPPGTTPLPKPTSSLAPDNAKDVADGEVSDELAARTATGTLYFRRAVPRSRDSEVFYDDFDLNANLLIDLDSVDGEATTGGLRHSIDENELRTWSYFNRIDSALGPSQVQARRLAIPAPIIGDEGLGEAGFRAAYGVNPFVSTLRDSQSTFGMDVDNASWARVREALRANRLPDGQVVRVEECVNNFPETRPADPSEVFTVRCEGAVSPFGDDTLELLKITVKSRELRADERKDAVLTFAIDTSGSMALDGKLGLVRDSLKTLVANLEPNDRVAIVAFSNNAYVALPHTSARQAGTIRRAIDSLTATGGTNVSAGIDLAYRLANEARNRRAANRVILCSDGVATLGSRGPDEVLARVNRYAEKNLISLYTYGFGDGGKKAVEGDQMLQRLANEGDGNYRYVDSADAARDLFSLPEKLQVLAADAKIQVEFEPDVVTHYRLLGYEKRDIADVDFRNDKRDAGEVGPGSTVTVLYEIKRCSQAGSLGRIFLRYRDTTSLRVEELDFDLPTGVIAARLEDSSDAFRFTAAIAEFAELLRGSYFARNGSYGAVLDLLDGMSPDSRRDKSWSQSRELVTRAQQLNALRAIEALTPIMEAGETPARKVSK